MLIKIACLCGLIILKNVSFTVSLSVDLIVLFTCNSCREPHSCCMGTLIQPNIVLTTSFCANFCQVTKNGKIYPIVKVYTYPHYRKYFIMQGGNAGEFSNIALALLEPKILNKKYVAISAIEPLTTVGLKIYIPVSEERKLRLQSTVIQSCENAVRIRPSAFHVCTGKTIADLKTCQTVQGAPLLLANRLLGISIAHDCRLTQKIFIAIGPSLFWISSTIKLIDQTRQQQFVLRNAMPSLNESLSTTISTTCTRSKNSTIQDLTELTHTMNVIVEKTTEVVANMTVTMATLPAGNTTPNQHHGDKKNNTTTKPLLKSAQELADLETTSIVTPSQLPTEMSSDDSSMSKSLTQSNNSLQNVMKWFKVQRNRLDEKPQSILVLTRPPYVKADTFVDLT